MAATRIFAIVDGDAPGVRARRLGAFEQTFALVIGVEYWLRAIPKWDVLAPLYGGLLALASIACVAILLTPWRRAGFLALAASHAVLVWSEFPSTGNHAYLELELCLLAAFLVPGEAEEGRLYLRAVRWLVVIVFFYSGLQKLLSGYYFGGEHLAFSLGSDSFRSVVGLLLPADELARLLALSGAVGDGPYHVAGVALPVFSNATWIAELALAPALCWRRTRTAAMVVALLLLAAIESAAREVFFGLVFASAILTFARGDVSTPARPVVVLVLLVLALVRLGVLPEATFY